MMFNSVDDWDRAAQMRGGYLQQTQQVRQQAPIQSGSKLAEALQFLIGWGLLYPAQASWLARCGVEDGIQLDDLSKLSTIGTSGEHVQNSRRDFLNRFCGKMVIPKPLTFQVYVRNRRKKAVIGKIDVMNPYRLVHCIWIKYRALWDDVFGAAPREFWNRVHPEDPKLRGMADLMQMVNWQDKCWPIVVHGDKAPFNKKGGMSITSMQFKSILTKDIRWIFPLFELVSSARACQGSEFDTYKQACVMAVHLLNFCRLGHHEPFDP